jgi:hypothetical protein
MRDKVTLINGSYGGVVFSCCQNVSRSRWRLAGTVICEDRRLWKWQDRGRSVGCGVKHGVAVGGCFVKLVFCI